MPEPSTSDDAGWRTHWPAAVLAVAAALIALWARHRLFPAYSWNRDEPVYLWHVETLRSGHLTARDGGHPALFQPWLSARGDGVLYTQYTLGWPLVLLAAAVLTGAAGNALLLGAALAVLGTYAITFELRRDRALATTAAALMVASPILPIQGGAYLSYLFTLGLGLLFGVCVLSGIRRGRLLPFAGAGLILGWIFMTRPYDALLWGLAFGGYVLLVERGRWRELLRPALVGAAGLLPLVTATLAYNRWVTGSWLQFPITAADPLDTFGFGPRRLMPTFEIVDYDLGKALTGTARSAFFLPWFLVGSYAGVALAAIGLWLARRERSTLVVLLVGLAFPVGYFVFWGTHLSSLAARIGGPIYYVPLYPLLCILIAGALLAAWRVGPRLRLLTVAALVLGTVPVALSRFDVNRRLSVDQAAWRDSVADIDGRAIVFVADTAPYLLYLNPFSSNGPDLDDRILYAADAGPEMLELIAAHPDRMPYVQEASVPSQELGPREHPYDFSVRVTPIAVHRGRTLDLRVRLAASEAGHVALTVTAGALERTRVLDGGDARQELVQLVTTDSGTDAIALTGAGTMLVTVGYGDTPEAAESSPLVRQRIPYRVVDGLIELLLPPFAQRLEVVDDQLQWRHAAAVPEAVVEVSPPSSPTR